MTGFWLNMAVMMREWTSRPWLGLDARGSEDGRNIAPLLAGLDRRGCGCDGFVKRCWID